MNNVCAVCHSEKSVDEFYKKDRFIMGKCKACCCSANRLYRRNRVKQLSFNDKLKLIQNQ